MDADIKAESFLKTKAFDVQTLLDELEEAKNILNVIVLDACRDNPFGWSRGGSRGLAVTASAPAGSIVVYATSAGKTAADGTGRNGLFTSQLLKNLPSRDTEVVEIFKHTGSDVLAVSGGEQSPEISIKFFGTAYLNGDGGKSPSPHSAQVPQNATEAPKNQMPAMPGFSGVWNGTVSYTSGGQTYRDVYRIELFDDRACKITIRAKENGTDVTLEGEGFWSHDNTFFRIECDFFDTAVTRLERVEWASVYTLDNNNRRLILLVKPSPQAGGTVKVTLNKGR